MATLHVTNGDSAGEGLRRARLGGDVLAWRDVLHEGPVHATSSDQEFREMRSAFLASRGAGRVEEIQSSFASRDAQFDAVGPDDTMVLWFEPDLYDQLQLCEILARLARRPDVARPRLEIVPADCLLGPLDSEQFAPLYAARRPVSNADVRRGADCWTAFTSPDPSFLLPLADFFAARDTARSYASDAEVVLPHLAAAIVRWLEELPAETNGLNRSEQQLLTAMRAGATTFGAAYRRSHHDVEEWIWLGDWSFAAYVERLSDCAVPAVTLANGSRITREMLEPSSSAFHSLDIALTDFGRAVEADTADFIAENGVDRWFGGAHLRSDQHWRWEANQRRIVSHGSESLPPSKD